MALLKNWMPLDIGATKKLKAAGNKARDAKDWPSATDAYQKYLKASPDDAGIWVQYGHALKEQGLLDEAETAYRQAATLVPTDTDSRLHLAHLLKRMGKRQHALTTFRELMAISPTGEVIVELRNLGFRPDIGAIVDNRSAETIQNSRYLELKDLFQYLNSHATVTGITRVTLALLKYIIDDMDDAESVLYNFVHQFGDGEGVLLIPKDKIRPLVHMATSASADLASMQALIADIRATSPVIQIQRGQLYLIVGAFWEFVAIPSWLGGMKSRGVIIGAYIYDLIPITHAHYCMAPLTSAFTAAFAETARLFDFVLTISEFVARQVLDYVKQHQILPFPTIAVPLAHEMRFEAEQTARRLPVFSSKLDELDNTPFVLCVCTIEARKNHIYLFYIWQRMIEAGLAVPDLIFVGRPGWRVQDFFDQIDASRNLEGRLHIMHGLSDDELSTLYDRCLFTVFPSFVEGWGLPVGESLARGKVCVASSTSSIPEVGGDLVIYVDPFNLESGYKAISDLVSNPASLARLEVKLRQTFVARTWKDVGRNFYSKLDGVLTELRPRLNQQTIYAPRLQAGEILDVQDMGDVGSRGAAYVANPVRLLFIEGWRTVETTGTWMLNRAAKLRLHTECKSGSALSVLLRVGTSPWVSRQNTIRISACGIMPKRRENDNSTYIKALEPNTIFWVRLKGIVDEAGYMIIHLRLDGEVVTDDPSSTPVAVNVHAVGYAEVNDVGARLTLLEHALMP